MKLALQFRVRGRCVALWAPSLEEILPGEFGRRLAGWNGDHSVPRKRVNSSHCRSHLTPSDPTWLGLPECGA